MCSVLPGEAIGRSSAILIHRALNLKTDVSAQDRVISLGSGLAAIPERLLLAHARGEVLFICDAGVSRPVRLQDFRELVVDVYRVLDASVHPVLADLPRGACSRWEANVSTLNDPQRAEVKRFIIGDYDAGPWYA